MYALKSLLLGVAGVLIATSTKGQYHHNAWFRATLSYPIADKIRLDGEFQHRRQSGFESKACLEEDLMYTLRGWVHYKYNESVRFSVSPFSYFSHHRIIQKQTDVYADPAKEVRFSGALDLQHAVSGKLFLIDRNALEYRIFSNGSSPVTRMRNRLGLRYDFPQKMKISFYQELFVNLAGTTGYYFFDHKRNTINLEYMLMTGVKIETGYMHIVRLPPGNLERVKESNLYIHVTFLLPGHHRISPRKI